MNRNILILNSFIDSLRNQHLPRFGVCLEPCCGIDRVSDSRIIHSGLTADISDNRFAAVYTDTERNLLSEPLLAGFFECPGPRHNILCGTKCLHFVILQVKRCIENRHGRISDEFIEGAAVFEDCIRRKIQILV